MVDVYSLTCPSFLIMGAFLQTEVQTPFQTLPLAGQGSCKMEEGVPLKAARGPLRGGGMSQPDPPSSRRTFSWFAKLRKPGSPEQRKGWWLELAQLALFLHPTSQPGPPPAYLSALVMEIVAGSAAAEWWAGEAEGPQVQGLRLSPALGLDPRGVGVGRRRSAPSMLARPGSGVSRGL